MAEPSKQRDSSRESWIFTHFPRSSKSYIIQKRISFAVFDCATWLLTSPLSFLLLLQIGAEWSYCYYTAIHSIGQLTDRPHIHSCYVPKYIFYMLCICKNYDSAWLTIFFRIIRDLLEMEMHLCPPLMCPSLRPFRRLKRLDPGFVGGSREFTNSNTKST